MGDVVNTGTFCYKATALSNSNYKLPAAVTSPDYTITPKTVTITADDQYALVNGPVPELTYQVEGLVDGDELLRKPELTCLGSVHAAGVYPIAVRGADAGSNYTITYVSGKLTRTGLGKPVNRPSSDVGCPSAQYSDLDTKAWYHDATDFVLAKGLMNGVGGGKFDPYGTTTRAMIVTILWRQEGEPAAKTAGSFTDVADGQWYTEAVEWANANGIVEGYGNGKFGPMDPITREQLAAILYRYAMYQGMTAVTLEENLIGFPDTAKVSAYAVPAMNWAVGQGIINGVDGLLDPQGAAIRVQAAQMLTNYLKK